MARCGPRPMSNNTRDAQSTMYADALRTELRVVCLDIILHTFDALEILDSLHVKLERGVLVHDDERPGVLLQRTECPKVVHALFNCLAQRKRLPLPSYDNDDLTRVQDGAHADRQRHARHSGDVVPEEACVREDRVVCERLDARAAHQRGAGLVERDVPVLSDASQEELDSADGLDRRLVPRAFGYEIWRVSVENVDLRRGDVDMREELAEHEGMVGLRVVLRQPDIFVHVKGDDMFEAA